MTYQKKFELIGRDCDLIDAEIEQLQAELERKINRKAQADAFVKAFISDADEEPVADEPVIVVPPVVDDQPEIISEPVKDEPVIVAPTVVADEPVIVGEPDLDDMEENDFALFSALHEASRDHPGEWLTDCQLFKLAQPHGFTLKRPSVSNRMTHSPKSLAKRYPGVIEEQAKPLSWRMIVADDLEPDTDDEPHVSVPRNFSEVKLDEGAPLPPFDETKRPDEYAAFEDVGRGRRKAGSTRWSLLNDQKTYTVRRLEGGMWSLPKSIDRTDIPLAIRLSIENGFTWTCNPVDASLAAALTDEWQNAAEIYERARGFNYRLKESSVRRWLNGVINGCASTIRMFAARGVVIEFKEMENRRHVWRVAA